MDEVRQERRAVSELRELVGDYLDACFEVEVEAHRARQLGARAWSSAPAVRMIHLRDDLCRALDRPLLSAETLELNGGLS